MVKRVVSSSGGFESFIRLSKANQTKTSARLATTVESLLRIHFSIPRDPPYAIPFPIPREEAIELLKQIAASPAEQGVGSEAPAQKP